MKKKLLYILIAAFVASGFSLLRYQEDGGCAGNYVPNMGMCLPVQKSRGWPLPVPLEDRFLRINESLWVEQFFSFFINISVYFVAFSTVYFAYSKLTRQSKKK